MAGVVGTDVDSNQIIPLYQALYSQASPQFSSENNEVLKAVSLVSSYTGNRGACPAACPACPAACPRQTVGARRAS